MKTKHILTAMVLPAMLAACTADEVVENNNVNLDGAAKLAPITFTVGNGIDSRLVWDESGIGNWKWGAEGDQFSAFLVNTGKGSQIINKLLTNYVYSSEDGANYTTSSVMTEGTYWFFAPGSQDKRDNDLISFKLPVAQDAEYYKSDDAQLFFTPLYEIAKEDAVGNIDLELTSWYGRAVMPITNNTDEDFTVRQIILTLANGKEWVVEGEISMEALNTANLKYKYVDGDKTPILNTDNVATNNETLAELKARLQKANAIVANAKTSPSLVLDLEEGVKVKAGKDYTFTMLVPATEANVSCNIKMITDKGIVEITEWDSSNYTKSGVQFKHNGVMPLFGVKNASNNSFKSYKVDEDDLDDFGAEYYVTTYDYMMELINTENGKLEVYNIGDWAVDARMAKTIKNSDAEVFFTQPMVVEDAENEVELTKVNFTKVTVAEGTEAAFGKKTTAEELAIEASAEVVLNEGANVESVDNAGVLTINEKASVEAVTTSGILNLEKNDAEVEIIAGELNYNGQKTYNANNLTINRGETANVNINIAEKATFVENKAIAATKNVKNNVTYLTTITNNGTISLDAVGGVDLVIDGKLVNNGTISGAKTALKINGAAENAGTIEGKTYVAANATVLNSGDMINQANVNNGTITAKEGSTTFVATGNGIIDNSELALVNVNATQTVQYVFTEACDSEDLMELDTQKYQINKLIFNGKVTLNKQWEDVTKTLYGVDVLEFAANSSLYVNLPTTEALTINVNKVIISANVKFTGFSGYSKLNMAKNYILHVCKNKTLTFAGVEIVGNGAGTYETDELTETNDKAGAVIGGASFDIDGLI